MPIGFNKQPDILTHPFVKDTSLYSHDNWNCVLVTTEFSVEQYYSEMYSQFDINYPMQMGQAVKKRQAEFLAGRLCAKIALQQLEPTHLRSVDIGVGKHRQPLWPNRIIGSITHSNERAMCLATNDERILAVGIDTEPEHSLETFAQIGKHIFNKQEFNQLYRLGFLETQCSTLLFSGKESIFKALFPKVKTHFDFDCARLIFGNIETKTLTFELRKSFATQYCLPLTLDVYYWINSTSITTLVLEDGKNTNL